MTTKQQDTFIVKWQTCDGANERWFRTEAEAKAFLEGLGFAAAEGTIFALRILVGA